MPKAQAIRLLTEAGAVPGGENHAVYDCNGLHIHMQYDEGGDTVLLYVHLGFLPEHTDKQTYEYMLELNFLGTALGGGHVGLHGPSRSLAYSLRLNVAQHNAQSLQNALHLFAGHALELLEVKRKGRISATDKEKVAGKTANTTPTPTGASAPVPDKGVMWG